MKNNPVTVIKRNHQGKEVWRYEGQILHCNPKGMLIEAFFNRDDLPFHGVIFKQHDRFEELYLRDHWFNIFAIHDRDTQELKAWYCNVTRPTIFKHHLIMYDDLALDLLVFPTGRKMVLDQDEFEELALSEREIVAAQAGLHELLSLFKNPAHFSFEQLLGRD
jgi:hypothetical protein